MTATTPGPRFGPGDPALAQSDHTVRRALGPALLYIYFNPFVCPTGIPEPRVAWFRDNRLLRPEPDDADDVNGAQPQAVAVAAAADGYAAATVTSSSSISTGGEDTGDVIEVDLTLTGLTRSDLHTELTCRAWNYFHDDEEYSIIVTNSGTSNIDTGNGRENPNKDVDPSRWTLRQRQSSLTAVVHVDMNCE